MQGEGGRSGQNTLRRLVRGPKYPPAPCARAKIRSSALCAGQNTLRRLVRGPKYARAPCGKPCTCQTLTKLSGIDSGWIIQSEKSCGSSTNSQYAQSWSNSKFNIFSFFDSFEKMSKIRTGQKITNCPILKKKVDKNKSNLSTVLEFSTV